MTYDGTTVQFKDRLLAHLQVVVIQKLMKQESFLVSWKDGPSVGEGRGSIWIPPSSSIYFKFLGSRTSEINKEWLLQLGKSADSSHGLIVTDEEGKLALSGSPQDRFLGTI